MKVIGDFSKRSRVGSLDAEGRTYRLRWEREAGYVSVAGISEVKTRIDDDAGQPVVFMRWLVADFRKVGGPDGLFDALESHSPDGADWASCLRRNCRAGQADMSAIRAIALLSLIATTPPYQGRHLGTPLARAFAETVLRRLGVHAIWIKPVPLREHQDTGMFKPVYDTDTAAFQMAKDRLERHYQRSLDAKWTCPDYLRVDLDRSAP